MHYFEIVKRDEKFILSEVEGSPAGGSKKPLQNEEAFFMHYFEIVKRG